MANPLLSVRIPPDLDELLPTERGARSQVVIEALRAYFEPVERDSDLRQIKQQISSLTKAVEAIQQQIQT